MLTTGSIASSSLGGSGLPSPAHESPEDNLNKFTSFLHSLAGYIDIELDTVLQDHCYARPWNWRPENLYVKPVKKIFFSPDQELSRNQLNEDDEIDVEHCDMTKELTLPYDLTKLRQGMEESQKLASFARPDENADDWGEKVEKTFWSPLQRRVFTRVFHVLSTERLTRLAKVNCSTEPIYRRISTDSSTQKFREILASTGWDWRIIQWLHGLLLDNLPREYLVIYLDILQTLRAKVPQLIEKMIAVQPNAIVKPGSIPTESLGAVLKRSWDPVATCLNSNRPKKLPGNPVIIVAPSGVGTCISPRQHKWITQLGSLGMIVTIHSHVGLTANRMTMMACMEQLVQVTRAKIQDVKSDCPGRAIILVGFNTGAALACQVAQMEHVTAVVCLGFPFTTAEGNRGTPDDTLLDIRCPILFVVGQNAKLTKTDDIEDIREKLLVESSLVVVGTADDHLRISTTKRISDGITQSIVDRCILDEIADFVASILLQPHPLPLRPIGFYNLEKTNKREQRKRKSSPNSSMGNELNFSNSQKKSRPSTPVDRMASTTNQISQGVSKSNSIAQTTLTKVRGSNSVNQAPVQRRRSKTVNIQKTSVSSDQSTSSKQPVQSSSTSSNGGLTLNIGSLASLGSGGPIKLGPYSASQSSSMQMKSNTSIKQSVTFTNVSKMIHSNNLPSLPGKIKTVAPTTKIFNKSLTTNNKNASTSNKTSNYKNMNIQEKSGDAKLVTVLASAGNQVRVSTPTLSVIQNKSMMNSSSHLTALLHSRKSTNDSGNNSEASGVTSSSTGLHSNEPSSVNTTAVITSTTTTKAMESTRHAMNADTSNTISITRITENTPNSDQLPTFAINENTGNPITILPWSSRTNNCPKISQATPKITVNQKNQWKGPQLSSTITNNDTPIDLDDELGNILDIPIIFAKDDDNLNIIEKTPTSLSLTNASDVCQQNISTKIAPTTKVVLLSNKEGKVYCPPTKMHTKISEQTLIQPNTSSENGNVIQRVRAQNTLASNWNNGSSKNASRSTNPVIQYTKIILSKRNSKVLNSANDQIIFKKNTPKRSSYQIIADNKNQQQLTALPVKIVSKWKKYSVGDALNAQDTIENKEDDVTLNHLSEINLKSIEKEEH